MTRIMFTGSRGWLDKSKIKNLLLTYKDKGKDVTLVHGGAKGLDSIVDEVGKELGFKLDVFIPDWSKGKVAALNRNIDMLNTNPDIVYAFCLDKSNGTMHTITNAKKMNLKIEEFHMTTEEMVKEAAYKIIFADKLSAMLAEKTNDGKTIYVDSKSKTHKILSPTEFSGERIKVPGSDYLDALTVQGIWEGLKSFRDYANPDPRCFDENPIKERKGNGFQGWWLWADLEKDIYLARQKIFSPTYGSHLRNVYAKQPKLFDDIIDLALSGEKVHIYDDKNNPDPRSTESMSHAVFVVHYLRYLLYKRYGVKFTEKIFK